MIIDQADLLERRQETLAEVFRFLDVDDSYWTPRYGRLRHETARPARPALARGRASLCRRTWPGGFRRGRGDRRCWIARSWTPTSARS